MIQFARTGTCDSSCLTNECQTLESVSHLSSRIDRDSVESIVLNR